MTSTGQLKVINIRPGINKNDSPYQSEGSYVSCQWARFQHDNLKKIGGWQSITTSATYLGTARDSRAWEDLQGDRWYAVGTNEQLSIYNETTFTDITPVQTSLVATSLFSSDTGSTLVGVSLNNNDTAPGDRFIVVTSVNVDGIPLAANSVWTVVSADTNNFSFNAGVTATSSVSSVGTSISLQFLLAAGRNSTGTATGWGSGPWGGTGGGWGVGVSAADADQLLVRTWVLDNWGEDLLANYRGGGIYLWDRSLGISQRAVQISGAPTKANSIAVINPPRILCCYGTSAYLGPFDPLLIRWSSNEDYTQFSPAVTNASGEIRLQDGNEIVKAVTTKAETVVFTDTGVYRQVYVGGDFIFSIEKVGANCGLISPQGARDVNGVVYWMSDAGFFLYNGSIQKLECSVYDNIFNKNTGDGINYEQAYKIFCGVNAEFSEIWWFYPDKNSDENNRYVVYNYQDSTWYDGILARTTWADASVFSRPLASGVSSQTYYHEVGLNADGQELPWLAHTSYFDVEDGTNIMLIDQYVPDFKTQQGDFKIEFGFKKYPESLEETRKGPFSMTGKDVLYMRGRGRQCEIRYSLSGTNSNIQIGKTRLRMQADGLR